MQLGRSDRSGPEKSVVGDRELLKVRGEKH